MKQKIYLAPFPVIGIKYKSSFATNSLQRMRLWLASKLLKLSLTLQLGNGETWTETGSNSKSREEL